MIRLLVVDDEAQLVRNIAEYLRSFADEFDVSTAGTGEEGVDAVAASGPEVLLTDVRLPGIDGLEVVRRALATKPDLKVVVMTAFGSSELRDIALREGAIRFVEKPVDLEELRALLLDIAGAGQGWSGQVGGLDIFDVAQLLALSGKSKVVRVRRGKEQGALAFEHGTLAHASTPEVSGEEAFYRMAAWEGGTFEEVPSRSGRRYPKNIRMSTTQLMIEAARLRDEAERDRSLTTGKKTRDAAGVADRKREPAPPALNRGAHHGTRKEAVLMAIRDHLNELQGVEGFQAAAIFSAQGEMLEGFTTTKMDIKTVGAFANNALLNAQKATDQMGVGRGNRLQIGAPQATILLRCLNEATDFAATAAGKAHFHAIVVLTPDGNAGMASMILEKALAKIADEVR